MAHTHHPPLCLQALWGDATAVQVLLAAGAAVDAVDGTRGSTALINAAAYGRSKVVQLLLDAGAAVDAADKRGQTALHHAVFGGHTSVMQQLLGAHASVDAVGPMGWAALHMAALEGHVNMVRLLLDAKADVNAASHTGLTAVSFASTGGHSEALSLLLAAPQLATETMAYAGGVAAANGHADIAAVVVKGLWVRDGYAAAAPCLAQQPVADALLGQWLAAEDAVRVLEQQQEAQWPAQQS